MPGSGRPTTLTINPGTSGDGLPMPAKDLPRDLTEWDQTAFEAIINTRLSPEQEQRVLTPPAAYPKQHYVLAVHWHPEFVPMDLITRRLEATFPSAEEQLVIPTQHNVMLSLNGYSGVEVDCYSSGFNRKVQLLLHFKSERIKGDEVLISMLAHTFRYRTSQLFEFIDSLIEPSLAERREEAAGDTGAGEELVEFVTVHAVKLKELIEKNDAIIPPDQIKNKLLAEYFDALREHYPDRFINRAQLYLKAVKGLVKKDFSLKYFYRASEVIEEVRGLGGGVVIPHPEQFWPILLADYDVDGIEVWNPQSREYTEFLIQTVNRRNRSLRPGEKKTLIFMGDDTHLSEKVKDPALQNPLKAAREVGVQPAWDDMAIRKSLIVAGADRRKIIEEYKARLA